MKRCPQCNSECEDKNHFCTKCGTFLPQPIFCTTCGARINEGERFCTRCGAHVENVFSNPSYQYAQNEAAQKPDSEIIGQIGLKGQNSQPVNGIRKNVHESVNEQYEGTPDVITENSEYLAGGNNISGEYYQNSESNNTKIWIGIIIAAIVIGGIVFWLYKVGYIGNNVSEPETPMEQAVQEENENVEILQEEAAESNNSTPVISANDIVYLSGKIDGKYPVHMALDLKQRLGVYYYDKYGASNSMGIEISQLRAMGNGQWAIIISMATSNGDKNEKWYGTLTDYNFTGSGVFLGKEMPFDLKVDSVLTDSEDPLIQKYMVSETNWEDCVFYGEVYGGGKVFKVKITAQTDLKGEFKNAKYHNLSYNVSFPVDVRVNGKHLYISGKSGYNDFRIEATSQEEGYEGHMYADGKSLPITLSDYDIVLE